MRGYSLIHVFGRLLMLFPYLKREINLNDLSTYQLRYWAVLENGKKGLFLNIYDFLLDNNRLYKYQSGLGPRVQKCQKKKHFCMPSFEQNFHLFSFIVHSLGSLKLDIALNLSLANTPVTACLLRYPSFSWKQKYVIKYF